MIYVFLATGFEDIEAIAPVDIIRRAGLEVQTVSITGEHIVTSAHGVGIKADLLLSDVDFSAAKIHSFSRYPSYNFKIMFAII